MKYDQHVVILNINEKVRRIVREILLGSAPTPPTIVVMIQDSGLWDEHPDWHPEEHENVVLTHGCPAEPHDLDAIRIDRAASAIILADPNQGRLADAHSTLVAVAVERRSPQVHTVIELISSVNRVHLRATEVNEVICLGEITEKLIAQCCITPGIHRVFSSLLAARADTGQVFIVDLPPAFDGTAYRHLVRRVIEDDLPLVVCGFSHRAGDDARTWLLNPRNGNPGRDTILRRGDRLVVIAYERPGNFRLFRGESPGSV